MVFFQSRNINYKLISGGCTTNYVNAHSVLICSIMPVIAQLISYTYKIYEERGLNQPRGQNKRSHYPHSRAAKAFFALSYYDAKSKCDMSRLFWLKGSPSARLQRQIGIFYGINITSQKKHYFIRPGCRPVSY